jgi:TRAP-type mannitol/chloroaromatic compound transport system permease small subunit
MNAPDNGTTETGGIMHKAIRIFVRYVDAVNYVVGRFAMYLFLVMGGILIYATLSRVLAGVPVNWALEMSQFLLSAYYLLGGAYSMQLDAHVRMDLLYTNLSARKRALTDAVTILFVIFYLIVLFAGGVSATDYAITYKQQNYSSWSPLLWPIKLIMTIAIFLMLLQAIATFFKDVAEVRGKPIA